MLEGFINNRIMVKDSVNSWEEAIKIAAEPMLKDGLIEGKVYRRYDKKCN